MFTRQTFASPRARAVQFTGIAAGLTGAVVAGLLVAAPQAQAQTGDVNQVRLAEPGKGWVARGDAAFVHSLGDWSNDTMGPDEVESRTYLVRNMDSRPGVWSVSLGAPATTDYAYFAVGTQASVVPGGQEAAADAPAETAPGAQPAPPAPAPANPGATWLAGDGTVEIADVTTAAVGTELANIELASCEAALITDWVALPDFTDSRHAGQEAQPNISVTFTPSEGDPEQFIDGYCDTAEPTVIEETATVGQEFELDVRSSAGQSVAVNGELPDWLTLRDGVLRGTPEATGTSEVPLTITDADGVPTDVLVRINVAPDSSDGSTGGSSGFNFWSWLTGLFTGSVGGGSSGGGSSDAGSGGGSTDRPDSEEDAPESGPSAPAWSAPVFSVLFGVVAVVLAVVFHFNRFMPWYWGGGLFQGWWTVFGDF